MRRRFCFLIPFLALVITPPVLADILVGNFGQPPNVQTAQRYRESDGAYLGPAGDDAAETNQGMTLGPDGMLYIVGNSLGFGSIHKNNPVTGQDLGFVYDPFPNPNDPFTNPFRGPNGLVFGHDGNIYSTSSPTHGGGLSGVVRFTAGGILQGVVIAPGNNGLSNPSQVWTMPVSGDLLVSDGSRINRYNKDTLAFVSTFVAPGSGGISSIFSSAFGPNGDLYLADYPNDRILRYDGSTGAFLNVFVASVDNPFGITFGNDGNFYALTSITAGRHILKYNGTTGAFISTLVASNNNISSGFYLLTAPDIPEPASAGAIIGLALAMTMRRRMRA
jgi:hypothetical protein